MPTENNQTVARATGLLVIEVKNSNPNGDPDRESDPRVRSHDQLGMITGVSFKRKLRDLVEEKDGPVWKEMQKVLKIKAEANSAGGFMILESRGRDREEIKKLDSQQFQNRYWDARVFGNTFLESLKGDKSTKSEEKEHFIRTGVAQFALGMSVAPVRVERMTNTNKSGVQEGKDRGMAPLGYRVVEHGVYCLPFFINPTAATKTGCTRQDIELLLKLIRYAYPHTASHIRPLVEVRHAWYAEHKDPLGSFSEFRFLEAMTPTKRQDPEKPSTSWSDYNVPENLPKELTEKTLNFRDLCSSLPDWCTEGNNGSSRS
jgi:Cas7 group CRISPR-associated protein Csh2